MSNTAAKITVAVKNKSTTPAAADVYLVDCNGRNIDTLPVLIDWESKTVRVFDSHAGQQAAYHEGIEKAKLDILKQKRFTMYFTPVERADPKENVT